MTLRELEQCIETYGTEIYSFCVYLTGTRHNFRKRILTTACALAALLVTGCAAMGIVKHYHATEIVTAYESYAELQQAEKDLGKSFKAVESFSNGFDFQSAALVNTEALDEKEEKLFGDHLLELFYQKGTDIITVGVETAEVGEMDGLVYCINYRGAYSNWDKYGAEELGQMAAEIIRAGRAEAF